MRSKNSKKGGFTLLEILIVIAILGVIVAIAIPNFIKTRAVASTHMCVENMAQIESAKTLWGLENKKTTGDTPAVADLIGITKYIRVLPVCPTGSNYDLNPIGTAATCQSGLPGHVL